MSVFRQPIEKRLSTLFGAEVTCEHMKVSLLAGSVDADGVVVSGDTPDRPLMTVRHVRGEIATAKALTGKLVIKNLDIEGAAVWIVRRSDGTHNFPGRPSNGTGNGNGKSVDDDVDSLRVEMRELRVHDLQIHYRDETGTFAYHISAQGIQGGMRHERTNMEFAISIASAGRRDVLAELGPMQIAGKLSPVYNLSRIARAGLEATVKFATGLTAGISCPILSTGRATVQLQGAADMAAISAMLPPKISAKIAGVKFNGPADITARAQVDRTEGVIIHELNIRATDIRFGQGGPPKS